MVVVGLSSYKASSMIEKEVFVSRYEYDSIYGF